MFCSAQLWSQSTSKHRPCQIYYTIFGICDFRARSVSFRRLSAEVERPRWAPHAHVTRYRLSGRRRGRIERDHGRPDITQVVGWQPLRRACLSTLADQNRHGIVRKPPVILAPASTIWNGNPWNHLPPAPIRDADNRRARTPCVQRKPRRRPARAAPPRRSIAGWHAMASERVRATLRTLVVVATGAVGAIAVMRGLYAPRAYRCAGGYPPRPHRDDRYPAATTTSAALRSPPAISGSAAG